VSFLFIVLAFSSLLLSISDFAEARNSISDSDRRKDNKKWLVLFEYHSGKTPLTEKKSDWINH
jgi:hypothetical protein